MANEELNNMMAPEGTMSEPVPAPIDPNAPVDPGQPSGLPPEVLEASQPLMEESGPEMSQEEMRADLDRSFQDVENQNNALETKKFTSRNKIKNQKIELLKQLYAMLEEAGVDPNDPESIKNFLTELEERDPDLVTLFEQAFNGLSPDSQPTEGGPTEESAEVPGEGMPPEAIPGGIVPEGVGMPPGGVPAGMPPGGEPGGTMMDKYSNLQENILR